MIISYICNDSKHLFYKGVAIGYSLNNKKMERFNKKTMSVYSDKYDELLKKEIAVWSKYSSGENKTSDFNTLKKTMPYQTYRKDTIETELEYIKKIGDYVDVLELGSADGWLTNEILKLDNVKSVYSIDISLKDNLKEKYNNKTFTLQGDLNKIDKINFDKKFNCIITHGTLHHLVDPKKTIEYCIDNLLAKDGIIIINDTWIHQSTQSKIHAFFYLSINRLGHAVLNLNLREIIKLLLYKIPKTILNKNFANAVSHAHETSPFESISSADDYKELYKRKDVDILYFRNFASLSGLQNSWNKSPIILKNVIQEIDNFLVSKKLLVGNLHICIFKKKI